MCLGCWEEEDRPFKVTDAVRKWAPVFAETNGWGAMHIVIEDWNLEDGNLEFCRTCEDVTPAEIELIDAMQAMSWEERWATAILAEDPAFEPSPVSNGERDATS
jgi:hypothetical protein